MEPSDGQPRSSVAFRLGFVASSVGPWTKLGSRDHIVRKVQWVSLGQIEIKNGARSHVEPQLRQRATAPVLTRPRGESRRPEVLAYHLQ
jgi:hypothetical protein